MVSEADLAFAALIDYQIGDIVLHDSGRKARVLDQGRLGMSRDRVWVQWLTPRYGSGRSAQAPVFVARHKLRIWNGRS